MRVKTKPPLETLKEVQEAIREVETALGDSGRVLVRYSGTEDICRVMVEAPKQKQVNLMANSIANVIANLIGKK